MSRHKDLFKYFVAAITFSLCAGPMTAHAARAAIRHDPGVFDFERVAVGEALRHIAVTRGIKININKLPVHGVVGKKYRGDDPEQVIRDIFWQDNVAIEWLYNRGRLETVEIRLYDRQADDGPGGTAAAPGVDATYLTADVRTLSSSSPLRAEPAETARYRSDAPAAVIVRRAGVAEMENAAPPPVEAGRIASGVAGGGLLNKALAGGGADAWAKNVAATPVAAAAAQKAPELPPMPPGFPD